MAMVDHFAHMLPRAATVLDAGCGTGRMLRHLQDRDGTMRLTGVDISSGMLAHAARRGIAVDLRQSDLADRRPPSRRSCTSRRRSPGSCGHSGSASTPSSTARPGRWSGTGRGSCSPARRADQPTRRTDVHGTVLGRPDPPPA
ncbi:class I SAM-dependent DNA methyltransferase [Curtobacterium sp. MCBD17_028]|uniref:class I SAM-dependent DNA methyltransferase n=1 Tax=Curtobacterium sp. MCBD17_028 TaxID=2175670 RepID=UPI0035C97CBA